LEEQNFNIPSTFKHFVPEYVLVLSKGKNSDIRRN